MLVATGRLTLVRARQPLNALSAMLSSNGAFSSRNDGWCWSSTLNCFALVRVSFSRLVSSSTMYWASLCARSPSTTSRRITSVGVTPLVVTASCSVFLVSCSLPFTLTVMPWAFTPNAVHSNRAASTILLALLVRRCPIGGLFGVST